MSKMLIDDGGVFEGAETFAPTMPAPMACGGAARRLTRAQDTGAETRRPESLERASACGAASDSAVMARRKSLRRRVLAGALVLAVIIAVLCWEYVPGMIAWLADAQAVRAFVADHAILSRLAMLGINMAQVLLAFLPGEPVELASGYAFGFWEGTALCLVAAGLATSLIYWGVRRWGWSLVGLFFDRSMLDRFAWLKDAKRLEFMMLAVFLIPGTPKDFLTYFAGLTEMRFVPVVLIATFGRIPSIVTSTIAASAVGDGNWVVAALALAASLALLLVGGVMYRRLSTRKN